MSEAGDPAQAARLSEQGFTLLETLVTLAILTLIVRIAFPSVDKGMRWQTFSGAAVGVERSLRSARAQAIRSGNTIRFATSPDRRQYGYGRTIDTLPEGASAATPDGSIDFFPDGSATGGRIVITEGPWQRRWSVRAISGQVERAQ
ncbi:MAG: prepilin-type N-terminal cleavage/methylation domain-containing protein [Sphingobium sp.]|nr:prepilin-type N-terminal cleavage/methylation domain-containing protein [Sphingobium sp.]